MSLPKWRKVFQPLSQGLIRPLFCLTAFVAFRTIRPQSFNWTEPEQLLIRSGFQDIPVFRSPLVFVLGLRLNERSIKHLLRSASHLSLRSADAKADNAS